MQDKVAIVAGNAPSLKEIDYKRMPENYDVFRCSQFYFEDKYYLGKTLKAINSIPYTICEQYYTANILLQNNEYEWEEMICVGLSPSEYFDNIETFRSIYPSVTIGYEILSKLRRFYNFCNFNNLYFGNRPTSGIDFCAIAISRGYKEIYIAGIDFYKLGVHSYAFPIQDKNLMQISPNIQDTKCHTKNFDLQALLFLMDNYDVKFYSLCPNSPISEYIPLAPIVDSKFILESKPQNYTKNIILPPKEFYNTYFFGKKGLENQKKKQYKSTLKNNLYYRIFKDLFTLPKDIRRYIKAKK
ncbi:alpha-2,3 sialyltransferase [Helicobacter saguini]|uniref:Alpha-2,3 sialyltransferase n=1 Tax=Helicobacter saguini TaxID=1548018 RepID=A0A347VS64_9HELI|nr:alpha-2,3-sialyltransferase [Helicobacter saguini]MWV62636.1 alpha-2,3 sialyltransferase [Helicobacter saguini]MWV66692.1 alpha-2,3 sialyltransferase [Helicobacter saguini]MWV69042.1 alpha-2,3 sialyltransferase [Helicobacter saguini]MWV71404.1 alpha-2,3 sialyltransferase [Helicobacter saguini]TLD94033.1 alpha-2,3 sialyltransferase [Helicobacter saguini]